jgi:hypothetical protein
MKEPFIKGEIPKLVRKNPGSSTALAIGKTYLSSIDLTKCGRKASSGGAKSLQEGGLTSQIQVQMSWPKGIGTRLSWLARLTYHLCALLEYKSDIKFTNIGTQFHK